MMMTDSSVAAQIRVSAALCSSVPVPRYGPSQFSSFETQWIRFPGTSSASSTRRNNVAKPRIQASAEHSGSTSNHTKQNQKPSYHPSEDIVHSTVHGGEEATLTTAEISRTIIDVNSKAAIVFTDMVDGETDQDIFWPEVPYATDEYGNIYFQVNNDEDMVQGLTSENNFVQVVIGSDTAGMLKEMELSGRSDISFGLDEIEDENSDFNAEDDDDEDDDEEDYEEDWGVDLENEQSDESDEMPGDWAKLETMRFTHPIYFAKKLSEVTSGDPMDCMGKPLAGLAIRGLLKPAPFEESFIIKKHNSDHQFGDSGVNYGDKDGGETCEDLCIINHHKNGSESRKDAFMREKELKKDEILGKGKSFYKLEIMKIQLISSHRHQTVVEVDDFLKARSDAIAHSATKIISRLKASGEKTTQALKSLCWRTKGIQVEEALLIGIDSLGFDLRVSSGTQVQTLRFAFNTRATSEYSAERQLNDLLFPVTHHKRQMKKEAHRK